MEKNVKDIVGFYRVFKCLNLIVPVGFYEVSSEIIVYSPFKINLNVLLTNQNQTKAVWPSEQFNWTIQRKQSERIG